MKKQIRRHDTRCHLYRGMGRKDITKKPIEIRRVHCFILISGLIMVGLGTWIGCSKDASISSTDPHPQPRATKPAILSPNSADFHPQSGVNYDPFKGMSAKDRMAAIGGVNGAIKYFHVIAYHLAQALNDDKVRGTLHNVVPKVQDGDIHLSQIAIEHPHVLEALSAGFRDDIFSENIQGMLSEIIRDSKSDGEAILMASTALLDLVVTLALQPGDVWDPHETIPVFYVPISDDEGAVMEGVDANLKTVSFTINGDKIPYSFLFLNYDEDSPMAYAGEIIYHQVQRQK